MLTYKAYMTNLLIPVAPMLQYLYANILEKLKPYICKRKITL